MFFSNRSTTEKMSFFQKFIKLLFILLCTKKEILGEVFSSNLFLRKFTGVPKVKKNFIAEVYAQSSLVCGMTCSKFQNCIGFYYRDYFSSNETNCLLENISTDFHMKNNAKDADKNTWSFYIMKKYDYQTCENGGMMTKENAKLSKGKCNKRFGGQFRQLREGKNCNELFSHGIIENGVYRLEPDDLGVMEVYCHMKNNNVGWTVIQNRQDGSVDFYRDWIQYSNGFGNLNGEFWLGLENIHRLTDAGLNTLRIDLLDFNGNTAYAVYDYFYVAEKTSKYNVYFGSYSGNAGDSLRVHDLMDFSTNDQDNDQSQENCAENHQSGWWYNDCYSAHLNGRYFSTDNHTGIYWYDWKNAWLRLKKISMKLGP